LDNGKESIDMSDNLQPTDDFRQQLEVTLNGTDAPVSEAEQLVIPSYPEDRDESETDELEEEIAALVQAAREQTEALNPQPDDPVGYVTNARNVASRSDAFLFWAPAEKTSLGIGSLVRHTAPDPTGQRGQVHSYGMITATDALTLGLDDFAPHAYEQDGRPPLTSIQPAPSRRRPVVNYEAKVLASTHAVQRPVLSGPVFPVKADELAAVHGKSADSGWPDAASMLLGFYEDSDGEYGVLAEERARVLGPKQGHVILSGLPGAGKTSLYQAVLIALYGQLRAMEGASTDDEA
jgi:hypothetical protein